MGSTRRLDVEVCLLAQRPRCRWVLAVTSNRGLEHHRHDLYPLKMLGASMATDGFGDLCR